MRSVDTRERASLTCSAANIRQNQTWATMVKNRERADEILDAVVRLNIETGRPVSSALVARSLDVGCSAATVRNVMKVLEAEGYLEQPHTSAGRRPTDAGFRRHVDRMLSGWPLGRWELPRSLAREVEQGLTNRPSGHAMVKTLAGLLSRVTLGVSIILGPSWQQVRCQRVELYLQGERRLLMVLVLENAMVRTTVADPGEDVAPQTVAEASRILSERIAGRTVAEVRDAVLDTVRPGVTAASRCASQLADQGRDLFMDFELGELELEGVTNVLGEPELAEPGTLRNLVRFLESPRSIREALATLDRQADGGLNVWIGGENPVSDLHEFAVVSRRFRLAEREGILAVLGPRRMPYRRALSGIDAVCSGLTSFS
ncbi:heat-inducible transcription repressor HrcA [bacterium]|nr:heat-inducible transcription repressor HrcA [bacterium]